MSADTAGVLVAHQLTKAYGDLPASGPIDLVVPGGQRVAMLGHNGSGKTTFLRMVAGLLDPTAGSVTVGGDAVGSIAARAATSYLGDTPVFYDDLSLWEHVEYIARLHDTQDWEQHGADLLEALGLTDRADDLPTTFSRGLRQKASIVLAFVRPFELLLVDEPFIGLDRTGRDALLELLRQAHAQGAAMIVATHELTTLADSDRLVALRDGSVVYDGPVTGADIDDLVTR
ncbi:MAG: ABC transporter ATP-binding protein [Desertimonas sp.]